MRRVTGQKLKPILIAWCCLYVALTNCDDTTHAKGNTIKSEETQSPGHESDPKKIQSHPSNAAELTQPGSQQLNSKDNSNITEEVSKGDLSTDKHSETESITSNDDKNTRANSPVAVTNTTSTSKTPEVQPPAIDAIPQPINVGALQRGFYVFLGLSVIVIAYIIFRCTRLSKNRTQMVRKYGILAHRQDVEMRPLPLDDEDEDDTTVFDASVVGVHHKRHEST